MLCSKASVVPDQRSWPQASVQRLSAAAESQVGIWTPLVTCPTGTSSAGQRGKSGSKSFRLTVLCRRLTPFTAALPRIARYAMLNGSDELFAFWRPSARRSWTVIPKFLFCITMEVLFYESRWETVKTRSHRGVGGKEIARSCNRQGDFEGLPGPLA